MGRVSRMVCRLTVHPGTMFTHSSLKRQGFFSRHSDKRRCLYGTFRYLFGIPSQDRTKNVDSLVEVVTHSGNGLTTTSWYETPFVYRRTPPFRRLRDSGPSRYPSSSSTGRDAPGSRPYVRSEGLLLLSPDVDTDQ